MLPNKKMDSFRDDNQGAESPSSEPHVVVSCPTCRTKFAVEGSLVASFETPRFHCSRCDAVFELGEHAKPSRSSPQRGDANNERRWILAEDSPIPDALGQSRAVSAAQPMLKPTDFSLGDASRADIAPHPPFAIFPAQIERPGLSLLGLNKPLTTSKNPTELAPIETSAPPRRTPPISVEEVTPSIASDPFSLFDDPTAPPPTPSASGIPTTPRWSVSPQTSSSTPPATQPRVSQPTAPVENTDPAESTPAPRVRAPRGQMMAHMFARLSPRTRSLSYLSAPIIVLMGVLTAVGYAASFAPKTLDAALQAVVPSIITGSAAQLPPSELSVQDISLEFVKTQSREGLGVVRGVVHNGSSSTLNEVRLEALGFDDRGQIVVRAQAPLRSALAREKVSDLSLATVRKFQESLSASSSKIAAGERVAFTIALLDSSSGEGMPIDLSQVRYFSARVFSVER